MIPLFFVILLVGTASARPITGSARSIRSPNASDDDSQPLTADETLQALQRAVVILGGSQESSRPVRIDSLIDDNARRIIRLATYENLCDRGVLPEPTRFGHRDPDYCPDGDFINPTTKRKLSDSTLANINRMIREGASFKTIHGKYKWYQRQYKKRLVECFERGGPRESKMNVINRYVTEQFQRARGLSRPIHEYMLRRWGRQKAIDVDAASFFSASSKWVHNFKKKNHIVSRKVTKTRGRAEANQQCRIEESKRTFRASYADESIDYPQRLVWNVDQTGFNYEQSNLRTLSNAGERDTLLNIDSSNKATHSYTSQPIISRDGRPIGKLLLCLHETPGRFGPRIQPQVDQLERDYNNVRVFASSSGKMSGALMDQWATEVLELAIRMHLPADNVCEDRPRLLLLLDSWGGGRSTEVAANLNRLGVNVLTIPPHTTSAIQPLDVTFNRQYKIFVNRVSEEAIYREMVGEVTSRNGIINVHSLIWNQFGSFAYQDMLRNSWRHTDPQFSEYELSSPTEVNMVRSIQFNLDRQQGCEEDECQNPAFIECSYCGRALCLQHFLQRVCFHQDDLELTYELPSPDEDVFDEDDEEFDQDLRYYILPSPSPSTTASTPEPSAGIMPLGQVDPNLCTYHDVAC